MDEQQLEPQIFQFHSTARSTALKNLEIKRILQNEEIDSIFAQMILQLYWHTICVKSSISASLSN